MPTALAVAAGAILLLAPVDTQNAVANGDTRTIHLHHAHTKESIDATYMVDGRYDPVALEKLNWFLRDWRRDEPTHMDPKLFDTVWEVYRESGSQQPIEVMSAYRSPETNSMLRHATRGVAEHSQHILGKAMDQHYVDVPMSRIRELAMRLQRGGVGFYPTAGTPFVHMDVGGVRHWPRMSYDQLSRLFPDGKTVHLPSNGQPLPGYEEARAELAARGDGFDYPTAGQVKSKGFFAWLFGGGDDEGDGEAARDGGVPRDSAPAPGRRTATQVASADTSPVGSVAGGMANNRKDDRPDSGGSLFSFFTGKPAEPAPPPDAPAAAPAKARGAKGRSQIASLAPAQTADADAQTRLAAEMQRQAQAQAAAEAQKQAAAEAQKQAAAEAQKQAAADAQRPVPATPAGLPAADPASPPAPGAPTLAAAGRDVPLPPRRPVEIASNGPGAPVPPARPGDAPSNGRSDHAPLPGPFRSASAVPPSARAGLPAAITQGLGQPTSPRVLAFAPPVAPAVPLPVERPPLVAARLDRSNFRSLTGATPADHLPVRPGVGSALAALRPAAQASAASLAGDSGSAPRRGFGAKATDLSTGSFSGAAVAPQERVSTATLHKRATTSTADD